MKMNIAQGATPLERMMDAMARAKRGQRVIEDFVADYGVTYDRVDLFRGVVNGLGVAGVVSQHARDIADALWQDGQQIKAAHRPGPIPTDIADNSYIMALYDVVAVLLAVEPQGAMVLAQAMDSAGKAVQAFEADIKTIVARRVAQGQPTPGTHDDAR